MILSDYLPRFTKLTRQAGVGWWCDNYFITNPKLSNKLPIKYYCKVFHVERINGFGSAVSPHKFITNAWGNTAVKATLSAKAIIDALVESNLFMR